MSTPVSQAAATDLPDDDDPAFEPAELQQADLDPATLAALFDDIATYTQVIGALLKGAPTSYAPDQLVDLPTARTLLQAGTVRGIQLRYRYQGQEWWDTLLRLPTGVRLVRINHSAALAQHPPQ